MKKFLVYFWQHFIFNIYGVYSASTGVPYDAFLPHDAKTEITLNEPIFYVKCGVS